MPSLLSPFISICIPAYKRTQYLKRLLESIAKQTFRSFEVIVSDDSGDDDSVKSLIDLFKEKFTIFYFKNPTALGTPANWNFCIRKAKGDWIKLMHDDDWFATPTALQAFANATKEKSNFIVSGYNNIDDNGTMLSKPKLSFLRKKLLRRNPMVLLSENFIGQPSVVMVHRSVAARYDERMKWRVDIDYYMQLLRSERNFTHIPDVLVNLGISSSQVTNSCLNVPGVELPEGLLLLKKYGTRSLKNILVYDAWWRIIRNTGTRNKNDLYRFASPWPKVIENMVKRQSEINTVSLQKGIISKWYMLLSFIKSVTFSQ